MIPVISAFEGTIGSVTRTAAVTVRMMMMMIPGRITRTVGTFITEITLLSPYRLQWYIQSSYLR